MKRILLDAGHGGENIGAQSDGIYEKEITLDVTLKTGKLLEHLLSDYDICYTRIADKSVSLAGRYLAIMDIQPAAFVSIHCNAVANNPNTSWDERKFAEGFEIFYRDSRDKPLAEAVGRVMGRSDFWRRNRGIKQDQEWLRKRLTVLNSLNVPSVLVELGFLSNPHERKMIVENTAGLAELVAHGIIDFADGLRTK